MGQFASDYAAGNAGIAYTGNRNDVWHRLGRDNMQGKSREEWLSAADLAWDAVKAPAQYEFDGKLRLARDRAFMVRSDTGTMLGDNCVTDVYCTVQPRELDAFFDRYISVDDRLQRDVMGHFKGGSIVWMTAAWRDPIEVAGDRHTARLLASTTFDGSGATRTQMCVTRSVCDNTLRAAWGEGEGAVVSTRHNTPFNAKRAGEELAKLAQSVAKYKAIGDAMAAVHMSEKDVMALFKTVLEIPADAKQDELSTRKMNQYRSLWQAQRTTQRERNVPSTTLDAWMALQAITRYVDHDRIGNNGDNGEKQFLSANFGSGDAMKGQAVGLLMPLIRDKIAAYA